MGKSWLNGTMILDSGAQGFNGKVRITAITIDPSAGSWVAVLSDRHGNVIHSQRGADARGETANVEIYSDGVVLTTATNLTRVTLTTESMQW